MHPNLAAKLSASGAAPASKKQKSGEESAPRPTPPATPANKGPVSDSVLVQQVRAVYRGDIDKHVALMRTAGLLQAAAAPKPEPKAERKSEPEQDSLFPLDDQAAKPDKPFTFPDESEVARRIQMALSAK